jgi:hypothetical protein
MHGARWNGRRSDEADAQMLAVAMTGQVRADMRRGQSGASSLLNPLPGLGRLRERVAPAISPPWRLGTQKTGCYRHVSAVDLPASWGFS